ncbi:zinc-binding of the histidine triad [Lecanosticta acicola]|uniref:Zinc-binding of the histidine triad n=1 Tax=Lecanosticta acicola TaxID=111012 RepID=A0AAI8Z448_9PEZI|nr:zinc-binding of the histidine triad [Lecanosticta acicola]
MSSPDELYPQPCAFCKISTAYPPSSTSPVPHNPDPAKCEPQCHLILSTPHVLAFLDIMPIAPGHILLTTRKHYAKLSDLQRPSSSKQRTDWISSKQAAEALETSRAMGEFLPVLSRALCRVTGVEDWNIVQNNGERAAQVVPHVHFHLIPRYQEGRVEKKKNGMGEAQMRSWRMFGRGAREDLDDEEGRVLAGRLREAIREEIEWMDTGNVKEKGRL